MTVPSGTLILTATPEVLTSEAFEDASLGDRGWYDDTTATISATEQYAGAGCLQINWAQGAATPTGGWSTLRHTFTATETLFLSVRQKFSSNWIGSQFDGGTDRTFHPHVLIVMTDASGIYTGPYGSALEVLLETMWNRPGGNGGFLRMAIGNETYPDGICYDESGSSFAEGAKTSWHLIEYYLQMNTVGSANGICQGWLDGALIINRSDVTYRWSNHATMKFDKILISPYMTNGSGSPANQTMYLDQLVLATGRV